MGNNLYNVGHTAVAKYNINADKWQELHRFKWTKSKYKNQHPFYNNQYAYRENLKQDKNEKEPQHQRRSFREKVHDSQNIPCSQEKIDTINDKESLLFNRITSA